MNEPVRDASSSFEAEAYLDAAAALVGLPVAAEHRPGVVRNLRLIATMADLVMGLPLGPETEPAPVFVATEAGA